MELSCAPDTPTNENASTSHTTPFVLQNVDKAEMLFEQPISGSAYDFEQILPMETRGQRRLAKNKLKQLKALDPIIRAMLHDGEEVIYLTDGVKVSSVEQFFIGWMMYYYNHNAFVFTSERILLIHVIKKKQLGRFVGTIRYEDLLQVKTNWTGNLRLKFRNKKQVLFTRVAKQDRTFIKDFLVPLVNDSSPTVDKQTAMIIDLCPACYTTVDNKNAAACPQCNCAFRTPKQAAIRSLILPGLGDLYLGSKLGYLEVLFMLFLWTGTILGNLDLVAQGEDPMEIWLSSLIFMSIIHLLDAAKSHYVARKGIFTQEAITQIRSRPKQQRAEGVYTAG